jgi:hypothetical protein
VNAEFNWWLLIVGLVVGAGLVWFVLADSRRREREVDAVERPREALWLSTTLADEGWDVPPEATERLLELHRDYLEAPPPDPGPEGTVDLAVAPDGSPAATAGASRGEPGRGSELAGDDRVGLRRGPADVRD